MATVKTETVKHAGQALLARPSGTKESPVVLVWSDIFQLTPPHVRMVTRLASHGFTVIAPEIYSRIEPPGTVLSFEGDRQRALDDSSKMDLAWIDEERRAWIDYAKKQIGGGNMGAWGFCFGGHLAFRAALEPEIAATACFYATGVHDGNLGAARGTAGTLERAREIRGELLLIWGANDPHIPAEGRAKIHRALEDAGVRYETRLFDAEHAFGRDEGPRWDPEATDRAFAATVALFRRRLA
ncbi:MAG: dienelactone hydrolase family protein [Polyangiales bacterium]